MPSRYKAARCLAQASLLSCVCVVLPQTNIKEEGERIGVTHAVASGEQRTLGTSQRSLSIRPEDKYYVSIAVAVFSAAAASRDMDYLFLAPLTALNWYNYGFHPLVFLVSNTTEDFFSPHQLHVLASLRQLQKDDILSLYIVPSLSTNYVIPISQSIRLFTAFIDPGRLRDTAFLRLTDVDVWIVNSAPFQRPPNNADIDCYGTFIYGKSTMGKRQCTQILMHSVGMEAHVWRSLFGPVLMMTDETEALRVTERKGHCSPVRGNDVLAAPEQKVVHAITAILWREFGFNDTMRVTHGVDPYWYMDQIMLGCAVEDYVKNSPDRRVRQTGKPLARLHLWDHLDAQELPTVDGTKQPIADIHLAQFSVDKDLAKIKQLLRERNIVPASYANWVKEYYEKWQAGDVASAECYPGKKKVRDALQNREASSSILAIFIFFCVGVLTGVMLRCGGASQDRSKVTPSARRVGQEYNRVSNEES